jgi:hypothetical protein
MWLDCVGGNDVRGRHVCKHTAAFYAGVLCGPSNFTCSLVHATSPDGLDWLHEVKYGGYRLWLERDGDRVRLITRSGYNWTECDIRALSVDGANTPLTSGIFSRGDIAEVNGPSSR